MPVHPSSSHARLPLAAEVDPGSFPGRKMAFRKVADGWDRPVRIAGRPMGSVLDRPKEGRRTRIGRAPVPVSWLH